MRTPAEVLALLPRLLPLVPDRPRFVETRWMLRPDECDLTGPCNERGFVVRAMRRPLVSVVGDPGVDAVLEALSRIDGPLDVLAFDAAGPHLAAGLDDFTLERALLFVPGDPAWCDAGPPVPSGIHTELLERPAIADLAHLSPTLRGELLGAFTFSPVVAAVEAGVPLAFCYASAVTGAWWDVAVETVPAARGRGLAGHVARHLGRWMRERGRTATWGAVESNAASRAVAHRLGFVPEDGLWLLARSGRGA